MRKYKLFSKILIAFSLLYLLFMIVLLTIMFNNKSENLEHEIDTNVKGMVNQVSSMVDDKLLFTNNIVTFVLQDDYLKNYLFNLSKSDFDMLKLYNRMRILVSSFDHKGYGIALTRLGDNKIISPNGIFQIDEYFKMYGVNDINMDLMYEQFNRNVNYIVFNGKNTEDFDSRQLIIVRKLLTSYEEPIYSVINLDYKYMFPDIPDSATLFIATEQNVIAVSSDRNHSIESLNVGRIIETTLQDEHERVIKEDGIIISCKRSMASDWHYFCVVDRTRIIGGTESLLVYFASIALVLIIIGIILSYLIAKNIHTPIRDILALFGASEGKYVDEVSLIRKETIHIQGLNTQLKKELHSNEQLKFFRLLLTGNFCKDSFQDEIELYGLKPFEEVNLSVAIISTSFLENNLSLSEMSKAIEKNLIEAFGDSFVFICSEGTDFIAVFRVENKAELNQKMFASALAIEDAIGDVHVALGDMCGSLAELHISYRNAKKIQEYIEIRLLDEKLTTSEDMQSITLSSYHYPFNVERDIVNSLVKGKKDEAVNLIRYILDENLDRAHLSKEQHSMLLIATLSTINRTLGILGLDVKDISPDGQITYIDLKMCTTKESLLNKFINIFDSICNYVSKEDDEKGKRMEENLLSYIHENYMLDISLADMSEKFQLSQTYLSSQFKSITGYNFKDYLSCYKIEMAKKLFTENPDLKISEVMELIGYNSMVTFLRNFNKYAGVTPGEYIKLIKNRER